MYYAIARQNGKSENSMKYFVWLNWKNDEELQLLYPNFEDYYNYLKESVK